MMMRLRNEQGSVVDNRWLACCASNVPENPGKTGYSRRWLRLIPGRIRLKPAISAGISMFYNALTCRRSAVRIL